MMEKQCKEWKIDVPWGKLALMSWGDPRNPPVLMVHGYFDSAATFTLLLEQLPEHFYYVGVDLPGHGKSDPLPSGLVVGNVMHMVEALRRAVAELKCDKFVYMAHSLGCIIGMFYNAAFPGRITKMINFDPVPVFFILHYTTHRPDFWILFSYLDYYKNYKKYTSKKPKLYRREMALEAISKTRSLTPNQAEIVGSRLLAPAGNGLYRFNVKLFPFVLLHADSFLTMVAAAPPMLVIKPSTPDFPSFLPPVFEAKDERKAEEFAEEFYGRIKKTVKSFDEVDIEGGHNIHITHVSEVAPHVIRFLNANSLKQTAKL